MGLDNGFVIKSKKDNTEVEIAYFRKFFELDDFIADNSKLPASGTPGYYVYNIDLDILKSLLEELYPTIQVLIKIPSRLINKYDEYGYPNKYGLNKEEFIGDIFNPITSRSSFAGAKALRLYSAVDTMISFLADSLNEDYYIEFYSSW